MDEQELIAQFQSEDLKADRILFDEFYQQLCYFTGRLIGDMDEGERIVIDVFEKLFQRRKHFNTLINIKAFLYISCRNRCLNFLRARQRHRKKEKEFIALQDDRFIEGEVIEASFIERIHKAVKSLPDQCRRVIELYYFEEQSHSEIAAFLGISENTVRNHKSNGIKMLRDRLGPSEFMLIGLIVYGGLLQYIISLLSH